MIYITHATHISEYFPTEFPRMVAHPHFSRIWISLRFIHTEIYFSKEAPTFCVLHKRRQTTENNTHAHKCDRKDEHEPNQLCELAVLLLPFVLRHMNSNKRADEQSNSMEYWFKTKPNQTKKWNLFILRQALSVISIKRLQIHSNERALCPFALVDFIWFSYLPYFIVHIRVFVYCGFLCRDPLYDIIEFIW